MRLSETSLAAFALLVACTDPSIGENDCTGERTRCTGVEPTPLPMPRGSWQKIDSAELPELQPTWQHALTFLPGQLPTVDEGAGSSFQQQGRIAGNGRAGLWYVASQASERGLELFRLDEQGEPSDSVLIPPPRGLFVGGESLARGFVSLLNDEGPGPILALSWVACEGPLDCAGLSIRETIALAEGLSEQPLRIQCASPCTLDTLPIHAVRSAAGGLWTFNAEGLRKYDAGGALELRQPLQGQALPRPSANSASNFSSEVLLASDAAQRLYLYAFDRDGVPDLWQLDQDGNVEHRYRPPAQSWNDANFASEGSAFASKGSALVAVDRRGRAVVFVETSSFELLAYRLDPASDEGEIHHVQRSGYTRLAPRAVSEDSAGNLYVISESGPRDVPVPMLCKLPLDGEMSCYLLPSLAVPSAGLHMVAGAEGVVYFYRVTNVDKQETTRETLARFDLP